MPAESWQGTWDFCRVRENVLWWVVDTLNYIEENWVRWICFLILFLAGCATAPPEQTEFMASFDGLSMSSRELKLRLYAFTTDFSGKVEHTADLILAGSDDPWVRQNAQLWKIHAIPAMHSQVFVEDPLVGSIKAYALCRSMEQFFSPAGAGAELFGPGQGLAISATDTLVHQVYDLIINVKPDGEFETFAEMVDEYVAQNPLRDLGFTQQSTMSYMAPLLASAGPGGLAAAGAMNQQMRMLNDRMAIYAESVPKQVRWQTELMLEQFPEMAAEQREALMEEVRVESLMAWEILARMLEEQRAATMDELSRERAAVMIDVAGERMATLEFLANERRILLEALQAERMAIVGSIEVLTRESLESLEASTRATATVSLQSIFDYMRGAMIWVFAGLVILILLTWFAARNLIREARRP